MVSYLCDEMLQKLARWLRIAGYDVLSPMGLRDRELNEIASAQCRILLTRDRDLSNMKGVETLRIISDDIVTQISEVLGKYPPDDDPPGRSRCPLCNGNLILSGKKDLTDEMMEEIPPRAYEAQDVFLWCSGCGKPFWFGKHWEGISAVLSSYGLHPEDLDIPP